MAGKRSLPYAAILPASMGGGYVGSFKTKAEASDALALAVATRPASKRADWTVREFYEFYKSSKAFLGLSASTQATRRSAWKHCERLGNLLMRNCKTHEWQTCIDAAVDAGQSKSSCRKIRELASQLCQEAMRDDVINKNYAELLIVGGKEEKARDIFTMEEIALLRQHDDDIRARFILILVYTGMRISELLQMPCENVYDTYMIGGSKTEAGKNRIIPILPEIKPYVDSFNRGHDHLIHREGKPLTANYAREYWFYRCLADLCILSPAELPPHGTPRITPHFSRHTFSTLAKEAGVDEKAIARIVGHTTFSTTDKHYVELQAEYLRKELLKMSERPDSL
jgi:integrase